MPLSATGLREGSFTSLRVLKNGVMQDVLSLAGGDSASSAQIEDLQSQLSLKASTSALNATAASIGADLDGVEVALGVVGSTVSALGSLVGGVVGEVATKAAQSSLDKTDASVSTVSTNLYNVAASLNANLNNVSTLLGTRASASSLTAGLALKQDLIDESVTLASGLFRLSGSGGTLAFRDLSVVST